MGEKWIPAKQQTALEKGELQAEVERDVDALHLLLFNNGRERYLNPGNVHALSQWLERHFEFGDFQAVDYDDRQALVGRELRRVGWLLLCDPEEMEAPDERIVEEQEARNPFQEIEAAAGYEPIPDRDTRGFVEALNEELASRGVGELDLETENPFRSARSRLEERFK